MTFYGRPIGVPRDYSWGPFGTVNTNFGRSGLSYKSMKFQKSKRVRVARRPGAPGSDSGHPSCQSGPKNSPSGPKNSPSGPKNSPSGPENSPSGLKTVRRSLKTVSLTKIRNFEKFENGRNFGEIWRNCHRQFAIYRSPRIGGLRTKLLALSKSKHSFKKETCKTSSPKTQHSSHGGRGMGGWAAGRLAAFRRRFSSGVHFSLVIYISTRHE